MTDGTPIKLREAAAFVRRRWLWLACAVILVFLVVHAWRPSPVIVDTALVTRGALEVTVDDDGRTRVRDRYTVSAPLAGRLVRTPLDPGDPVRTGETVVAEMWPSTPGLLDARTRAEAEARLARAEAALQEADARRAQAAAEREFARIELERVESLFAQNVTSRERLEMAQRDEQRATQGLRAAASAVDVARSEAEIARASLREPSTAPRARGVPAPPPSTAEGGPRPESGAARSGPLPGQEPAAPSAEATEGQAVGNVQLRSPVDGVVLRVFEEDARIVAPGTPLVELGDTASLEIVAEYLSQDAVRVSSGMPAYIVGWGASDPTEPQGHRLLARVRRVEPAGFTKVSALGVEEQRVNILLDPVGADDAWRALGDGYRVDVRIVLWSGDDVVKVPTGALFRSGVAWAVYAVERGTATLRTIEIGRRNGLEAEVLRGLETGDRVILYPSDLIANGADVEPR